MKTFLFVISVVMLTASKPGCHGHKASVSPCFKGRLELKGACANYTVRLLEGNLDTSLMAATWTDSMSGKTYNHVFAVGSRCTFPDSIREGQEFYFVIDSNQVQQCMTCMIYFPKPDKRLPIRVLAAPCSK